MKRLLILLLACLMIFASAAVAEEIEVMLTDDGEEEIISILPAQEENASIPAEKQETVLDPSITGESVNPAAREDFIERIIALGKKKYEQTGGKAQRAHYASDIYVCKNFTVYLFRQNRDDFRMAAYPKKTLVIPDNLPKEKCKPYAYGLAWKDIAASDGNPFFVAAEFRYNTALSEEENMELALEFMRQVQRGDYFQMTAKYEYGTGAHSAIMISDYDPETNTVHWMDSNMRGKKVNGIRYGVVQYDEVKEIDWWAKCFCQKTRGATIYRLRYDIVYASDVN